MSDVRNLCGVVVAHLDRFQSIIIAVQPNGLPARVESCRNRGGERLGAREKRLAIAPWVADDNAINPRELNPSGERRRMKRVALVTGVVVLALGLRVGLYDLHAQATAARKPSDATMERIRQALVALADGQAALTNEGVMHCCIKPACAFCAISGGDCPCADNLKAGKGGVCPECFGGWYAGQGSLDGKVTTNSDGQIEFDGKLIKVFPIGLLKNRYAVRAQGLGGANPPAEEGQQGQQ
jgi:hypothetical protein